MRNHNFGNLTGRFGQYVVDIFFVVDIIRIGGNDSLGSVQIVISPYDENANFSCPNKNYFGGQPSLVDLPLLCGICCCWGE